MTRVLYFSRSYRVYFKGRTSTRKNIAFWISKRVATRKQFSKCHEEDISVFPPTFSFEAYMNLHQAWRLFCRNHLRSLKSFNSLDRVGYQHQHVRVLQKLVARSLWFLPFISILPICATAMTLDLRTARRCLRAWNSVLVILGAVAVVLRGNEEVRVR